MTTNTTFSLRMNYARSARKPIIASGLVSREVGAIFIKALEQDDTENGVKGVWYDLVPDDE